MVVGNDFVSFISTFCFIFTRKHSPLFSEIGTFLAHARKAYNNKKAFLQGYISEMLSLFLVSSCRVLGRKGKGNIQGERKESAIEIRIFFFWRGGGGGFRDGKGWGWVGGYRLLCALFFENIILHKKRNNMCQDYVVSVVIVYLFFSFLPR